MMPAQGSLTSSLALLVLLGTVRAGPFSPRSNVTLPGPRPPPHPGGRTVQPGAGSPSSQLYEHTVEGGEKQVVFTHRINLPPSAGCGCPPGTEPPVPASEVQALKVRLDILEELVKGLKEQCTAGCCPAAAQAGTGHTDVRSLCSLHGVFDLSRCACSCEPGWGGPTCSDPIDAEAPPSPPPSASSPCPDDCNDQGRCVRGRCVCFPGYTGPSCSWPSCPGDCHGRGRCVQGVCVCRSGFSGDDCSVRSCPRGCSQRGRCENGRCVCNPGYTGEDCGVRSCPRGCSQKGRCEDGRCVCDPGYAGEDCGSRSCPWDCGEGGRCVDGRCVCWPGYAGEDCSTRTCPRDCRGRGRCEDGECICDPGYSGDDCGVRSCPGDCNQRGRCEDGRCVCWPGYSGPDCGARACPRDCRGRGRCENGVCVCNAGYSGEDCGVRSCPGDCRGRGRCESGRCVCWPGYTGRDCGTRACPGDCRGRGRCVDGRCVCNSGFTGEDCGSRRCPGDCRGRGRCEDGVCLCDVGYEGQDCGTRSCPRGCQGHGRCLEGRCVCDDGYEGEDCGVIRCPRDCNQRGVCQDGVCTCWEGYTGEDCSLLTCPSNCHRQGRCEDGRCVCDSGYTGPSCAIRTCPADCRGRGRCVQGVCVCHAGYSGEDCGQEEPPASACPGGCGPRELCHAGQCVCVEGFRGPDCAIQTCPGDCRGRGECREGSCICQDGYAGEDCGEEVPAIEGMRMHLLEETTVRTEWTRAPGNVDAYEIQFIPTTEGESPPFTARVPSSASAYDQRGLAPGQEYQVTVRALRGTSWGPPASKAITTMIDGPQDLRVVAVTPTTLELNWLRPQAEVDRFVVSYVSAGNQRVRLEVPSEADGTLLTGLMPGVEYVVTVTAERGRAVSYPASVRANTAPGHYSYPEAHSPAPPPKPRPRLVPAPRPPRPARPSRPAEEGEAESRPGPSLPQPPRRAWGNLTAELGRFRGTVQDLEHHLRAHGYPLRANQTYTSVARHIHEYLQRRRLVAAAPTGSPAPQPRRPHPTSSPDSGTWKRDSNQGIYGLSPEGVDRVAAPRHPKPEVLGSSADGALLVSLDGLRGHFERVVLRWRPQPPAEGPGGELTVPGTTRTVSLPDLKPGTTYHVEVHGVRAGQTSKSYAFITTTGSSPSGFPGATDEPSPSGPSTTQGAQAPILQQRPQELAELRVLGRDKTGRLRVAWTAQPDTFDHFQLRLRVPEGPGPHEELVPGDARQALVPLPPPGSPYELSLRGVPPGGEPSAPLIYQGIMDRDEEKPGKPLAPPRLGKLTVTDMTSNSLLLHWTVPEGEFDSFVIQYKDRDRPQVVPVEGPQRSALISNLEVGRKYKFVLYGLVGKRRHGPLVAEAKILPQTDASPVTLPHLGKLWVTDPTPDSLHLSWTVPEGQFDSFVVQYRDGDGRPQVMPVEGAERSVTVSPLEPDHKYRFALFGIASRKRHGPLTADGTTAPEKREEPRHPESPEQPLLGELTVTGTTPDSLRLSWTVAQGSFDSFMVQYKDAQGRPQAVPVRGDEKEVTIPGLESDRKYKMNLYGLHGRQRVGPVSVVATTAPQEVVDKTPSPTEPSTEAPEPPEEPLLGELTVTGSSPASLSLSWTVPQGHFDSFTVQYRDRDRQPKVIRVPGHEDKVTIPGLEPDQKYKMNLYGFYDGQRVGPVSVIGVTAAEEETPSPTEMEETPSPTEPSTEAPEHPEEPLLGELTVTGSSQDSLSLSWTVPQGHFNSFTVQYKGRDGPQVVRVEGEESEVTVGGLEPGHKYKMHLYGLHEGQRVGPVSIMGVTAPQLEEPPPATEPPLEPRLGELTVTDVTPNSMGLAWTVPEGQFDSFVVQYKDKDGQPQAVPVAADQREATVPGLEPARKYKMNLYGLRGGQRVGPLSVVAVTAPLPPAPATEAPLEPRLGELTVTDVTPDSVGLSWTVTEGEFDSFVVQYKDRDGQPQVVPVAADQREVTVPGLEPNRKYKFLLFGIQDGKRRSPVSVEAKTVAHSDGSPGAAPHLGELWVTDPAPDSLRLSWTVPEGHFDSFVVQFKDRDGPQVVPVEGHKRSVTISPLDPGRKYRFLLYGLLGKRRHGPLTAEGTTETRRAVDEAGTKRPSKPRLGEELQVTGVTSDSVGLSWTVPEGQFDSFVVQYKDRDGQPQVVPVEGSLREVSVSGLDPARRYKLLLYGLYEGKRVGPISAIAVTAPREEIEAETEAPSPPASELHLGEVTVEEATPHTLHLSWMVTEGEFDSFVVQYTDEDGQLQIVHLGGDQNDITLSDLESDHRYLVSLYGFHEGQRVGPAHIEALTAPGEEEDEPSESPSTTPEPPVKPRLGELAVTDATPDSLSLSWTVPEGHFDHFLVQYKNGDGQPKAVRVPGHEDGVTISGLEPDEKYKMNLYGFHDGQRLGPVSVIGVTTAQEETPSPTEMEETPSPTEPSTEAPEPAKEPLLGELMVTGSSPDSLSLSWTVPQGHFDSFTVQYKGRDGPQVVRVGGEESEVTIGGLEPGRKYKMNLYGFHDGQRVGPISVIGVTAAQEETPSPTEMEETPSPTEPSTEAPEPAKEPLLGELMVTGSSPDSLSLSWTVPQGHFDSFTVQYKGRDGPQVVRVGGEESEVTIGGLEPGRKYKMNLYGFHDGQRVGPISVIGVTAAEEETPSPTEMEETPSPSEPSTEAPEPPEEPLLGELMVTGSSLDSLSLSWTVPQGHFDSFTVQYRDRDRQPKVIRVPGHEDKVTIPGLEPDQKYKMNLYGFHDGQRVGPVSVIGVTAAEEETPSSTEMEETPSPTEMEETPSPTEPSTEAPEPPEEPLLGELMVTGSSPDSLSLSWTVPQGHFDSFTVQYKGRDGPQVVRVGGEESEVTVGGLEPGRKYKMHLYGLHRGQRVGPVSTVGVTAPEEEPPASPHLKPHLGELTVTDTTSDSLGLSWTIPEGQFDHFLVQFKNGDGQPKAVRVPGHEDGVTISGLEPDQKYTINLYGFHGGQRVGPVSTVGLTASEKHQEMTPAPEDLPTAAPEPSIKPHLGELAVTDATPDSLSLSWTVPEGHFDHFLVQYKNGDGQPKAVRVPGHEDGVTISGLEPDQKYKMNLYGFHSGQRVGPVSVIGVTTAEEETPSSTEMEETPSPTEMEETPSPTEMEETPSPTEPSTEAPEPPEEPLLGELTVTGSSPDSLSLSWTVPQGHFDSFTVQYKGRDGPQVVRVWGEESEVTVGGLEPGRKYKVHLYGLHGGQRVGPVSTVGVTAPQEVVEETPSPTEPSTAALEPPEEPLLGELTVTGSSPDSLSLSWTVPQGHFDSFTVQYKGRDGPQVVRVGGEESEVTVEGLEPGRKYKMNLYGLHSGQRVGPVSTVGVTAPDYEAVTTQALYTAAPEPPVKPRLGELAVTDATPDSLSLSWTVPEGHFDHFLVQYKNGDGQPKVVRVPGHEDGVTISGLEPDQKYKMNLYGFHGGQRMGPVSVIGVTTAEEETPSSTEMEETPSPTEMEETPSPTEMEETPSPTEPSTEAPEAPEEPLLGELTVTGSSPDSLSLSWTVPQGHFDSFTVQYKGRDGPQVVRVRGEESEVTVGGLEPRHKYKMHLYGLHGGQRVGPVTTVGVTDSLTTEPPVAPRLGELAVAAVTSDTVHLSWTVDQGPFDSFLVQYKDVQGRPQAVPADGDLREVTVSGLAPARKYKFLLFGLQDEKRHGPVSADAKTLPDTKPSPRLGELTVTHVTPDSMGLSWTVPEGEFDSFVVQYKDRDGQSHVVPVASDQREITIPSLEPNRKYKLLLFGLAGRKRLGPISAEGSTAPLEKERQPSPRLGALMVTDETPDSLRLLWTVAQGPFDSFVVQYRDTDGQPQVVPVAADQRDVTIDGLKPGRKYKFLLYGLLRGQRLGPASVLGVTGSAPAGQTPGEPGPHLSHLSVTDVTTSSLRLNWEAPPEAFDSFLLRYGVPSPSTLEPHPRPPQQRELTVPGTRRSAVLRDLHPGTLYTLTLYGLRGPHKADSVQGTARTLSPVLESPRDLQFSEIRETSAKVSWMPPPSRVDSFKVSYQLADGGEPQSVQLDGRARTQKLEGLIPGAHYEVTVVSVRGFEESEPLTGFLATVPDGPTQLRALNLTGGSALLHWTPPQEPVDAYDVKVTAAGAPSLHTSAPGGAVDHPLRGLVLHTNYTATLRGLRGPNLTSPASITFTTGLEAPHGLEAKAVTPRTALLTWAAPQVPPTGYLLSFNTPGGQTQEILLPGGVTSHQLRGLFPSTPYSAWLRAMWGDSFTPPVSTSFTTGGLRIPFPRDCGEEMQNGVSTSRTTTVFLNGNRERPLNVFCDMETDEGGWLVFQRRMDGKTDFWRDWEDYAHGFGNISGEFWLGNEALHSLTKAGDYSLRVDLRDGDEAVFAQYDSFQVDSADEYYRLHLEGYHGTAGDSMSYHSGSVFSARDRDPNNLLISCAVSYRGAWWYRNCHYANLNGLYGSTVDHQGVSWYYWKGFDFSVPFTEMKLRPRSYRPPGRGG
ncbi:tenascin-X isoform X3 [Hippopotamus amphibius kiboko]|uniref:tenascin-X isoform X3 n=1 Tax=Hippopotamus amphibius kiboko TaxID=575201 RepID=UPI002591399D|nr:tenascin-X isoform X3 [Hippopotamus amphibius kiboko]